MPELVFNMPYAQSVPLDKQKIQMIDWQSKAVDEIIEQFVVKQHKGCVLRGGTGLGKMFITARAIRQLLDFGHIKRPSGSIFPFPVLWVCPKNIKLQTMRVLKDVGIAHLVMVLTYGELKSSTGTDMFLTYVTKLLPNGQPEIIPQWNPMMAPALIVCDEIQMLKNEDSLQAKTIRYAPDNVWWIGASATPWQRVGDARTTVERCGVVTKYNSLPCTIKVAPSLLRNIASPKRPDEYSPSAVGRLREAIEDYIVELKNVRFKFQTKTSFQRIHFKTLEQRQAYEAAYEEYLEELRKKNDYRSHGRMAILVAMQKFQQKAEFLRCDQLAERTMTRVKEGKQVIVGSNYVDTCRQVWRFFQKFGQNMDRVGFIVGGQTEKARQEMVDKFQAGLLDIMLITVRSGGVGISLHHDRPESRPRHIIIPIPWSAIDLVQFLGRGHRLTSMSHTTQESLYYADTIEDDKVVPTLERKVKCLAKSVTAKEQFITLFEPENQDTNEQESDEINELITEQKESTKVDDVDKADSGEDIGHEGLESSDEVPDLPVSYR